MIAQLGIREHEESAKKALLLKRKELRWKLMEASQLRNRAKLEEIRLEADYNKKKVAKILALANKLRAKYMKVAKAAKIAESHYKKVELKLLTQEKFVADEKMQLTKLAVDCQKLGSQIFGNDYCVNTDKHYIYKKLKLPTQTRLSSLYDLKDSFLRNLASYRLTTKFLDTGIPITDLNYTHNICPDEPICLPDLVGACPDRDCIYQHKSSYLMTDLDKLADILSYRPSLTGFKSEPELDRDENEYRCRIKLKQYSAKLLVKNSDKPVEVIAQNLVKYIRGNKLDHELLTMSRELPKVARLVCVTPSDTSSKESEEFKNSVANNDVITNDDEIIIKIDD